MNSFRPAGYRGDREASTGAISGRFTLPDGTTLPGVDSVTAESEDESWRTISTVGVHRNAAKLTIIDIKNSSLI